MKRAWTVAVVMAIVAFLAGVAVAQMGWVSTGPGMGWGHMGPGMTRMGGMTGYQPPTGAMTEAKSIAQQWLDRNLPGTTTETPDEFYVDYTVHTRKDGKISGVLSVNGYGGAVWYHTWHGAFITNKEAMG